MSEMPFQLECAAVVAQHIVDQFEAAVRRGQQYPLTVTHTIGESELFDSSATVTVGQRSEVTIQLQIVISEYLAEWIDTCCQQAMRYGSVDHASAPSIWTLRSMMLSRDSPETSITLVVTVRCINPLPVSVV